MNVISWIAVIILLLSIAVLKITIEEGPLLFFIEGTVDSIWMLLLSRNARAQDLLSRSPLPWLGRITLGIFVIHTPVYALLDSSLIPLLRKILPDAVVLPLFFLPAVGLCILGAWLLHRGYSLLQRRTRKREAVPV